MPKKRSKQTRTRNHDLRTRIEHVKAELLRGVSRPVLLAAIQKGYKLKIARAYEYLQQAEREIQEDIHENRDAWLREHIAIRRNIRKRASDQNDLRLELDAAKDEAKLLGLDVSQTKVELTGKDGGPVKHEHSTEAAFVAKLNELTDAFASAIARETGGDLSPDGSPQPVDS